MKRFYGFLVAGLMLATVSGVGIQSTFAQDDPKTELYNKFLGCRKETDPAKETACYALAEEYMQKYGADNDEYSNYVDKQLKKYKTRKAEEALFNRFNTSIKGKNWDEAFASGKEILAKNPDLVDVMLVLASIGYDNAIAKPPVDKYNADAINMAKMAIQKIEKGVTSETYGAYEYTYKTKAFPDGKSNALGWMNYTIGFVTFYNMKMKKDALPYLYKATQFNSETKSFADLYRTVGSYYLDEVVRMETERQAKIKANGDQDNEETIKMFALQKGYAERGADSYARAYKIASGITTATKEYKDSLLNRAKELYSFRFDKNMSGFDTWVSGTASRPFPDPSSAVTPVELPKPAENTTGTTATPTTTVTTGTKPATTTTTPVTTKPATTTPATTTTTPATTPPAKKPAPKKPVAKKKKG